MITRFLARHFPTKQDKEDRKEGTLARLRRWYIYCLHDQRRQGYPQGAAAVRPPAGVLGSLRPTGYHIKPSEVNIAKGNHSSTHPQYI